MIALDKKRHGNVTHLSAMRVRLRSIFDLVANVKIATRKSGLQSSESYYHVNLYTVTLVSDG